METLFTKTLVTFLEHADAKESCWFFQHFYSLLPRRPFLAELKQESMYREQRHVPTTWISLEYSVVTNLVESRLVSRMRGNNMGYTRWREDSIRSSMRLFRQHYEKSYIRDRLSMFVIGSRRRFLFFENVGAPFSICLIKTGGIYGAYRKRVLFCFLDIPPLHVDLHQERTTKVEFLHQDLLVESDSKLVRDTDDALRRLHALMGSLETLSSCPSIISEWTVNDFFRFWKRW